MLDAIKALSLDEDSHWSHPTYYRHQYNLRGHHGCVNALALSNGEATFLASSGDDRRVLIWPTLLPPQIQTPIRCYTGHRVKRFRNLLGKCVLLGLESK